MKIFYKYDKKKAGWLTKAQFNELLESHNVEPTPEELDFFFKAGIRFYVLFFINNLKEGEYRWVRTVTVIHFNL